MKHVCGPAKHAGEELRYQIHLRFSVGTKREAWLLSRMLQCLEGCGVVDAIEQAADELRLETWCCHIDSPVELLEEEE